jgi:two-component system, cell cycle sensor histidine kinase and response regulator CckA
LSRLYETLSQVNHAIIRARSHAELFPRVCEIVVEFGHFKVAWIDWLDPALNRLVIAAKAGDDAGVITEEFSRQCRCGLDVMQPEVPRVINDLSTASFPSECRKIAETLGLGSVTSYPIRLNDQVCGVLTVGLSEERSLDDSEAGLLKEMTRNISFALDHFEAERRCHAAEDALKEGERFFQKILQGGLDGFYLVDKQGRLLQVNEAYCAMSGYTREELLQMRVSDVEVAETAQDVAAHMRRIISQGKDRFESFHQRKDGRIISIESTVNFQNVDGGRFYCFLREITESKRAEEVLRRNEEHLTLAVGVAALGIFERTHDPDTLYCSARLRKIFGWSPDEKVAMSALVNLVLPEDRKILAEGIRQAIDPSGEGLSLSEYRIKRPDGIRWVSVRVQSFFQGEGILRHPVRTVGAVQDITEQKQAALEMRALELQLRESQKIEAVGRLAGGVAHDFNNLLMVIQSYTEMAQDLLPLHSSLRNNTEQVLKAAERGAALTRQLLAFSRKQVLSPVILDLNAVVSEAARMLMRLIGEDIELRLNPAEPLWTVKADSDQLAQVLMNLCVNARDAMPEGGRLTIATRNFTKSDDVLEKYTDVEPGDYVLLAVTDTGMGIATDVREQMFEPFFTTKERGKGTGLGLSTVFGIVKQSGGHVLVDSELGQGACFTICLPRTKDAIPMAKRPQTEPAQRGTETLLVVEDESALREAICDFLRSFGYTLLTADSGQKALSIASQHAGIVDLLITDVVMPQMNGRELSQILGGIRPEMKTIFMSGYTDDAILQYGVRGEGVAFLQKPFKLDDLAHKVRDMLGPRATGGDKKRATGG